MKIINLISILSFFVCFNQLQAQNKRIYLFNDFRTGTVLMKNKSKVSTLLNYDAANKVMIYKEKDENMNDPESVIKLTDYCLGL